MFVCEFAGILCIPCFFSSSHCFQIIHRTNKKISNLHSKTFTHAQTHIENFISRLNKLIADLQSSFTFLLIQSLFYIFSVFSCSLRFQLFILLLLTFLTFFTFYLYRTIISSLILCISVSPVFILLSIEKPYCFIRLHYHVDFVYALISCNESNCKKKHFEIPEVDDHTQACGNLSISDFILNCFKGNFSKMWKTQNSSNASALEMCISPFASKMILQYNVFHSTENFYRKMRHNLFWE